MLNKYLLDREHPNRVGPGSHVKNLQEEGVISCVKCYRWAVEGENKNEPLDWAAIRSSVTWQQRFCGVVRGKAWLGWVWEKLRAAYKHSVEFCWNFFWKEKESQIISQAPFDHWDVSCWSHKWKLSIHRDKTEVVWSVIWFGQRNKVAKTGIIYDDFI